MIHLLLPKPLSQYTMAEMAAWSLREVRRSGVRSRREWKRIQRIARASGLSVHGVSFGRQGGCFPLGPAGRSVSALVFKNEGEEK